MVIAEKARRTVKDPDSNIEREIDLGFVGEPKHVNRGILDSVLQAELIPVLAPVATGEDGQTYNVTRTRSLALWPGRCRRSACCC